MPLTVQENQIGQLWTFAEISRVNTAGGEGVKIMHNEEFNLPIDSDGRVISKLLPEYEKTELTSKSSKKKKKKLSKENGSKEKSVDNTQEDDNEDDEEVEEVNIANTKDNINSKSGQFTRKVYYLESKLPWFLRKVMPKDLCMINEHSWNMYPTVKTVITNDYFKNSFRIQLDTITKECKNGIADDNVHNLTSEQLEKREVIELDIIDEIPPNEYKVEEDPLLFNSVKTGRGPLQPGWAKSQQPLICVYKLACIDFKVFGLQTKVESYIKNVYKNAFAVFHRQIFCAIDKWHGLTIEDVRDIEKELAKLLVKKIEEGELSKYALAGE